MKELIARILAYKTEFFGTFFLIMVLSYGFLYVIDFIPEPIEEDSEDTTLEAEFDDSQAALEDFKPQQNEGVEMPDVTAANALPLSISIDALDRTVQVLNPTSRNIDDLDAALLSGVVRHPDSADFNQTGNMFILGHSSYLPNVFNRNFQAFNGIQELSWGDVIRVRSADTEYVYRVERVYEAPASEVTVPNSRGTAKLTLATCNTFGAKEDRYIVEAGLVTTRAI